MRSRVLLVLVLVIPVVISQRDGYYSKLEAKDDHYKDYSLLPEFRSYSDRSKYSPSYYADDQFADFPGGSAHDLRSAYARRGFVSTNLIPSAYTQGYIRARILSPTYVRRGYLRTHIMSPYRRGFFETNAVSPAYARRGFLGTKAGLMGSSSFARRGFLSSNVMQPYLPYRRGLLKDNMMSPYYTRRELLRSEIDSPYYVTGTDYNARMFNVLPGYTARRDIYGTPIYYDEDNFSPLRRHRTKIRSLHTSKATEVQG